MNIQIAGDRVAEALREELIGVERCADLALQESEAFCELSAAPLGGRDEARVFEQLAEILDARLDELVPAPFSRPLWQVSSMLEEEIARSRKEIFDTILKGELDGIEAVKESCKQLSIIRTIAARLSGATSSLRHQRDIARGLGVLQECHKQAVELLPPDHSLLTTLSSAIALYAR